MKFAISATTLAALFAAAYANANAFTSPLGGETWTAGESVRIAWANASGSSVTLELVQGESNNVHVAAVITDSYPNNANSQGIVNVNWAIPSSLTNGRYALEIINNDNKDEVNYSGWIEIQGGASNFSASSSAAASSEGVNSTLPSSAVPSANISSSAVSSVVSSANLSSSAEPSSSVVSSFANSSSVMTSEASSAKSTAKSTAKSSASEESDSTVHVTKSVTPTASETATASSTKTSASSANVGAVASAGFAGVIGAVAFALL